MQIIEILQAAWKYLTNQPEINGIANNIMDQVMKEGQTTSTVCQTLERVAAENGWQDKLDNQIWTSLKHKTPDEIIPHALSIVKELGIFDLITNFLFPKK